MKKYYIYMLCNQSNSTLYVGVTNDLERRVAEHKGHLNKGSFTDKYNCGKLVYYEEYEYIDQAISREKQLKNWKREWKNKLVETLNPQWEDLMAESEHKA